MLLVLFVIPVLPSACSKPLILCSTATRGVYLFVCRHDFAYRYLLGERRQIFLHENEEAIRWRAHARINHRRHTTHRHTTVTEEPMTWLHIAAWRHGGGWRGDHSAWRRQRTRGLRRACDGAASLLVNVSNSISRHTHAYATISWCHNDAVATTTCQVCSFLVDDVVTRV